MQRRLKKPMPLIAITALIATGACNNSELEAPTGSIASSVGTPRCIRVVPSLTIDTEPVGSWNFRAKRFSANGSLDEIAFTKVELDNDVGELCVSAASYNDALLIEAHTSEATTFVTRYLPPIFQNTVGDSSLEALPIDLLTTHLTSIMAQVHQLPFSGFIGKITEGDFERLESRLRLDAEIMRDLRSGELSELTTLKKWNLNVDLHDSIGRKMTCLNDQISSGSFSVGQSFSFPDSLPEPLSENSNTTLKPNGTLANLAGAPIKHMETQINGVRLQDAAFTSIEHLGNGASGVFLQAPGFEAGGALDAHITLTEVNDGHSSPALLPCVVGLLTVQNNSASSQAINAGSSICFNVVERGNLFFLPSDGAHGDWPSNTTEFIVFGDDRSDTSFVLGVPGIHSRAQDDKLRITIADNNVCLSFAERRSLAPSGEMNDLSSVLWYLCSVTESTKWEASSRMLNASTAFEIGLRPTIFGSDVSRDELATEIGRSSFVFNPSVINFIKVDVRDSLRNFFKGNKANVIFSGKGIKQSYSAFLNANGDALAQIETGPQGQWMGALQIPHAKPGDFIRFKAPSTDQRAGAHFDIPIQESCTP